MAAPVINSLGEIFTNRLLFIKEVDCQIIAIGQFRNDEVLDIPWFWIDELGTIHCGLFFYGQRLSLDNGGDVLTATTFDDLVEQLDQIKIIAGFGGLDDALTFCVAASNQSRVDNGQPDR